MRTTFGEATVRLYHLDDAGEGGAATTLFYGPLNEALDRAAQEPEAIQDGLAAKALGDTDTATAKLGRAVQLAAQTGN